MKRLFTVLAGVVFMLGAAAFLAGARAQDVPVGVQTKLTVELSAREAFPNEEGKSLIPTRKSRSPFCSISRRTTRKKPRRASR